MKDLWKLIKISQRYRDEFGGLRFWNTVYKRKAQMMMKVDWNAIKQDCLLSLQLLPSTDCGSTSSRSSRDKQDVVLWIVSSPAWL